jgi:hypothetical protein
MMLQGAAEQGPEKKVLGVDFRSGRLRRSLNCYIYLFLKIVDLASRLGKSLNFLQVSIETLRKNKIDSSPN